MPYGGGSGWELWWSGGVWWCGEVWRVVGWWGVMGWGAKNTGNAGISFFSQTLDSAMLAGAQAWIHASDT